MKNTNVDLSLVIACYLDERHLRANIAKLIEILHCSHYSFELILVNDASPDGSAKVLAEIYEESKRVGLPLSVFHHPHNIGRGGALETGFRAARGDICAFIDIDLEPDPAALLPIIEMVKAGADFAVGRRIFEQERFSLKRYVLHYSHRAMVASLLKLKARDPHAGLKAFRRMPLLRILPEVRDKRWFWDTELVAIAQRSGLRIEELTFVYRTKANKPSTVHFLQDTLRELRSIIALFWRLR